MNRASVARHAAPFKWEDSMKLAYAAVAAAFLAASPVKAQVVDLSTITCSDFSARPADQMANIMFWLEGYYTEDDDPTTIDFAEFKSTRWRSCSSIARTIPRSGC
jgi:hypothetical protein